MIIKYCGYFFIDSAILNGTEKMILADDILKDIINSGGNDGVHLLLRASRDGFDERVFHKLCDGEAPTITIIQSNYGSIFGGYTTKPWLSSNVRTEDKDAFTFLIRSNIATLQIKCPMLFEILPVCEFAICGDRDRGPIFGEGYDISIGANCNDQLPKHEILYMI